MDSLSRREFLKISGMAAGATDTATVPAIVMQKMETPTAAGGTAQSGAPKKKKKEGC